MQNDVIKETNIVLDILRNDYEISRSLFGIWDKDFTFFRPSELATHCLDYFYKTTWLFTCAPLSMDYSYGVIENGDILVLQDDESMPSICCNGLHNLPLNLLIYELCEEPEERCILINRIIQSTFFGHNYQYYLNKFIQICKNQGLQFCEVYDYNLEKDSISTEMAEKLYNQKTDEDFSLGLLVKPGPGCYPKWEKGEYYYPNIFRESLKPVTKLYTPRMLTSEFYYPDVKLVEHKVDGENFDLDEKYIQE